MSGLRPVRGLPILFLLVAAALATAGQCRDQSADSRYQTLLATARAGNKIVDWQALRFAYSDRPGFTASEDGEEEVHMEAMRKAYAATDYAGALVEAKLVADLDFVDPEVHLIAGEAYEKSGDSENAGREKTIALGLLNSIQSGSGLSAASPFTVIKLTEAYVLMATLRRHVTRESLTQVDGHSYDVLETLDVAGAPATYYFQIDRVIAAKTHVLTLPGKP